MKTLSQISLFACLCMMTGLALAQDVVEPDRDHRRGMSYEEYSSIREKMRVRMEHMQRPAQTRTQENTQTEQSSSTGDGYGRDYQSRSQIDRPDVKFERPERPQFNRPERPDVFRR